MRILYLNPSGQMGGAETSLCDLLAAVRAAEPDWDVWLVLGEEGPLAGRARGLGVEVLVAPFPPALARVGDAGRGSLEPLWSLLKAAAGTVQYARNLARIFRRTQPDLIHTNGFKMHCLAAWVRPAGTALIWHVHDYVRTRRVMRLLLGRCYKRCAAAIVNSRSVAADLSALLPSLRVVPVYNAIDLERFSPTGASLDLDRLAGLAPAASGTLRVGLVSTFARWKGHEVFLKALSRLPADAPVRGYIIGGPIYQTSGSQWSFAELDQQVSRLGLAGRVGFTGFVDEPAAAMRSLDVVVHASTQPEPFGMVIVEGMACGRPVIAARTGGAAELFTDGENALAHPPGNADMLAEQILRLARNGELRRRLGAAGRATAQSLYRRDRLAAEVLAVYASVLGTLAGREPGVEIESAMLHGQ